MAPQLPVLFFVSLALATHVQAQSLFHESVVLTSETQSREATLIIDLNGDGIDEIVVAPRGAPGVRVFRPGPDGQFVAPELFGVELGDVKHFAPFDFDGDGDTDLVVLTQQPPQSSVHVLVNVGGDLTVTPRSNIIGGLPTAEKVAAGRLIGSSSPDFVVEFQNSVADPQDNTLVIFEGRFVGVSPFPTSLGVDNLTPGSVVDVDQDGFEDLVVSGRFLRRGGPNSTLGPRTNLAPGTVGMDLQARLRDMDADGDVDLVIASDGFCRHFEQTAPLVFTRQPDVVTGLPLPRQASIVDLNGDSMMDVIVNTAQERAVPFLRTAGGGWSQEPDLPLSHEPAESYGDFDGDGLPEGVRYVSESSAIPLEVYRNESSSNLLFTSMGPVEYPGYLRRGLAAADFDNDGDLEVVTSIILDTQAFVREIALVDMSPSLEFPRPRMIGQLENSGGGDILTGDFNGDGNADIAVGSFPVAQVWIGDGAGNFAQESTSLATSSDGYLAVGDLNGDGLDDLAFVGRFGSHNINRAAFSSGSTPYFPTVQDLGNSTSNIHEISVVDANGDGREDLVIATDLDAIDWFEQTPGGILAPRAKLFPQGPPLNRARPRFGDLNGDGLDDCMVCSGLSIYVALGAPSGLGAFVRSAYTAISTYPLELKDLDGDGDLDGVVYGSNLSPDQFLVNDGTGTIVSRSNPWDFEKTTVAGVLEDFDGDGDIDFLRLGFSRAILNEGFDIVLNGTIRNFGTPFCVDAVPNSMGQPATIRASGSPRVFGGDLRLRATGMPVGSLGIFLGSATRALPGPIAGSQGNLCLGGSIGRYVQPGQIQAADAAGSFRLTLDPMQLLEGGGPVVGIPNQRWHFQAWYRDTVQGMATSNLTDAIEVRLE